MITSPDTFRVCIVSPKAFGALTGGNSGHIGGIERQTAVMAKWLAGRGHDVSFITWNEGMRKVDQVDGIRIFRLCRQESGLPGFRFLYPRWTSLVAALEAADANIYYQNGSECLTGQVALWCRRNKRKFIFSTAANLDVQKEITDKWSWRDRTLYQYGLRNADCIIVQTRWQQAELKRGFGLESSVIPMPCPGAGAGFVPVETFISPPTVLWVGRFNPVKRLEWFLDLAELCPNFTFAVVGPAEKSDYSTPLIERARTLKNVQMIGRVPPHQTTEHYRKAAALICTSVREGFPNTFLEAWSHGVPVVSTLDVDGLIRERNLGAIGETVPLLASALKSLLESPDQWRTTSANARRYYLEHHTVDEAMQRFVRCFESVVAGSSPLEPRGQCSHADASETVSHG